MAETVEPLSLAEVLAMTPSERLNMAERARERLAAYEKSQEPRAEPPMSPELAEYMACPQAERDALEARLLAKMNPPNPCPECGTQMRQKGWLMIDVDSEGRGGTYVYQCPSCKNIEID